MFLNNRHSIHFSDESHSKGIEEFVPKNSLGQKKFFWPMDKICLFTESSSTPNNNFFKFYAKVLGNPTAMFAL